MRIQFPSHFLWGAGLSSYQSEGGNFNTDWCLWEKEQHLTPAAGACDHYHLYERDFQVARQLNLNALRISVEWSRVMPQENVVDQKEVDHYKTVVAQLLKQNLTPIITLYHLPFLYGFIEKGDGSTRKM